MQQVTAMFLRGGFFFIIGVVFATLFVWSMVQGVLSHIQNKDFTLFYYFASWLAGVGALALYHQSRAILHYAQISK